MAHVVAPGGALAYHAAGLPEWPENAADMVGACTGCDEISNDESGGSLCTVFAP